MHLRHIRPRSVDWYDATLESEDRGFYRLSPEEKAKLLRAGEPDVAEPALVALATSPPLTRQLL
jgi:hypothetical protein